ncbi:polyadenylation and cleavage factor homolog 4 [Punica granatum]|uniref:Polyadenylation and cleavage factor homolog 4 n=1 Tax=Punica granatum TaxID=22663 RepID=A0A6P8DJL3_PUNGR|nr:polyadenylation and cleavage factor homolog 4 [Punica granatum]
MDRDKLAATLPRPNPRNLPPFLKPMPAELPPQKAPPSILDRFRALLKLRDDEGLSPPGSDEIVRIYESMLTELTFNSKPIITDLTIIAGEQKANGEGIADAICARIIEAPVDQKLPSLYLLDSIVKNIGKEYVRHFSSRLPEVFCEAYRQVDPSMYGSMRHLFGTWSTYFPPQVLRKIETELRFSTQERNQTGGVTSLRSPESPRPSHGIHVNPKYVRQLDHSAVDSVGTQRLTSPGQYLGPSPSLTAEKLQASSRIAPEKPFSSEFDEFSVKNSPRKYEKSSPSHPAFEYGHGRLNTRMKYYSEDARNRLDASTSSNVVNGRGHQNLRALIDAYGNDERESSLKSRPLAVDRVGNNKVAAISWQDTEEQEFDWENMNPTLADGSRRNETMPFGRHGVPSETDIHRKWSSQPRFPSVDESKHSAGNAIMLLDGDRGLKKLSALRSDTNQSMASRYSQEARTGPNNLPQTSRYIVNRGTTRNFAAAFSSSGMHSSAEEPLNVEAQFANPTSSLDLFPSINQHKSQLPLVNSIPPSMMQIRGSFHPPVANTVTDREPNQALNNLDSREMIPKNPAIFPNQQQVLLPLSQCSQAQATPLPSQFLHQKAQENFLQPPVSTSYHGPAPSLNYVSFPQGPLRAMPPAPGVHPSLPISNIPSSSFHLPRGSMPSLPTAAPSLPALPISQGPGVAYSGLISSLMAQGLISLANQAPVQDSVGLEFDVDRLKVRHESAVRALYADLPRQCTTCGLRFRSQDEHSSHMDWHVTKNRTAKNRKHKSSRKWFVSTSMWLSGAEALGAEAVPGFLPTETVEEKKSDEEMAVPADEDQNVCALCGESFEDFFNDETEEWMYKGAVYLNAPLDGSTAGLDRSQLGPIVHAKCRSESSGAPPENFGQGGSIEESSQRKRLRLS